MQRAGQPEYGQLPQDCSEPLAPPVRDVEDKLRYLQELWLDVEAAVRQVAASPGVSKTPHLALQHLSSSTFHLEAAHSMLRGGMRAAAPGDYHCSQSGMSKSLPRLSTFLPTFDWLQGAREEDVKLIALSVGFVAVVWTGMAISSGAFQAFDGNVLVTEIIHPSRLMPYYLFLLSLFTSSTVSLLVFGPPDVSKLDRMFRARDPQSAPAPQACCSTLLDSVKRIAKAALQFVELGSFAARVLSGWAFAVGYVKSEADRSPTLLSWVCRSIWASMVFSATSAVLPVVLKQAGLGLMMVQNMAFVRAHHKKWYSGRIVSSGGAGDLAVEDAFRPFHFAPREGFVDDREVQRGAVQEVFMHPQGLVRANGPIAAVMVGGAIAWGIVNLPLFGYVLVGIFAYIWVFLPAFRLWLLFLDNLLLPALIAAVGKSSADVEKYWSNLPELYDTPLEFATDVLEKRKIMAWLSDPTNTVRYSRIMFFFAGFFHVYGKMNVARWVPRCAWWCPGGRLTPETLYDKEVDTLKRTGVTYSGWTYFLSFAIVFPCFGGVAATVLTRFLSGRWTPAAYLEALNLTLMERHFRTFLSYSMDTCLTQLTLVGNLLL